jgi:hypothetical protein
MAGEAPDWAIASVTVQDARLTKPRTAAAQAAALRVDILISQLLKD